MGFGRGLLTEALQVVGVVSASSLACNGYGIAAAWISPWWPGEPATLNFLLFLVLLVGGVFVARLLVRKITDVVKWERLHWAVQGIGMLIGAVRGAWWAGLVLLTLLALGIPYLSASVNERSVIGSPFVALARTSLETVADRLPGHAQRPALIPAITVHLPSLPELPE